MAGRTSRTIQTQITRLEENSSGLLERLAPEIDFLPTKVSWEDPPQGYVPIDLADSPFFVPPNQGSEYPDPSDYGLTASFASVEIEEISVSGCHICVTFSYAIGFVQFPSSTVCYIRPGECRRPPPHEPIPLTCTTETDVSWEELENSDTTTGIPVVCPPPPPPSEPLGKPGQVLTFELWSSGSYHNKRQVQINDGETINEQTDERADAKLIATKQFPAPYVPNITNFFSDGSYSIERYWDFTWQERINKYRSSALDLGRWTWMSVESSSNRGYSNLIGEVGFGTYRKIVQSYANRSNYTLTTIVKIGDEVIWPKPDEPRDFTPKRYMPRCCENSSLESLLRQLLKRVGDPRKITVPEYDKAKDKNVSSLADALQKWSYHQSNSTADLYKVLEPRAFDGAEYPMRLTHAGASGNKPVRNYLQAWEAILRQVDTAVGLLPFKIKIEDTNAAQDGKQSLELQVHSISDALKLLVENVVDIEGDGDTTNNLLVRLAAMQIQQHQVLAKIQAQTSNTEEFLDYKVKQKIIKIPSTLNPILPTNGQGFGEASNLNQNTEQETERLMPHLLKNTELKVKVTEIDEKRLLSETLYSIEKFAAATAAGNTVHYKGTETLKKLLDGIMENDEFKEFLDRQNIRKALEDKEDLNAFVRDVEKGYPSAQGLRESDPEKPYGRPKQKAPKAKKATRPRRRQ